jgi:hypothetical protein
VEVRPAPSWSSDRDFTDPLGIQSTKEHKFEKAVATRERKIIILSDVTAASS